VKLDRTFVPILLYDCGKHVRTATVHELRSGRSDRSQKQADLVSDNLAACGTQTLIDVGLAHTLNDTYLTNKSKTVHAKAANAYAKQEDWLREGDQREVARLPLQEFLPPTTWSCRRRCVASYS
jgi:hypothetical protein